MKIALDELRNKVLATLEQSFDTTTAQQIADCLLWADMSGIKPMGLAKMTGTEPLQKIKPLRDIAVERDTQLSQIIDAGSWPSVAVCQRATDVAIAKAKEHGFGIVGVHNLFSSNAAQAFYADRIAAQDLIGIIMTRAPGNVAPFDSIDPLFGTDPISFSFPTKNDPLIFDMSTAAMTWSGLVLAKARGEQLPKGIAIDKDGNPTLDPTEAMNGATLPFDRGYKGSGLGLIIELMAGPLVRCNPSDFNDQWSCVLIAVNPNLFVDTAEFKKHCSELLENIKQSRKKPGVNAIRLPGERALASRKDAMRTGLVDVDDTILQELGYVD